MGTPGPNLDIVPPKAGRIVVVTSGALIAESKDPNVTVIRG